jgi:hypothetical protein
MAQLPESRGAATVGGELDLRDSDLCTRCASGQDVAAGGCPSAARAPGTAPDPVTASVYVRAALSPGTGCWPVPAAPVPAVVGPAAPCLGLTPYGRWVAWRK